MPILTVIQNNRITELPFEGTPMLSALLEQAGVLTPHPCGGRGTCLKCQAQISGEVSVPTEAQRRLGKSQGSTQAEHLITVSQENTQPEHCSTGADSECFRPRLICQTQLLGDTKVLLSQDSTIEQIETGGTALPSPLSPMPGKLGAAVDIGTTTVVLKLCDLTTGQLLGSAARFNSQTTVAADVMGRIEAALNGKLALLQQQILEELLFLLEQACRQAGRMVTEVESLVLTGNTTMLYLLTGRDPVSLSHAPFEADCLFDCEREILGKKAYLPPCMNAFVGADITCALLASRMTESSAVSLLCDLGTNGELALWKEGRLYVTSTAAGPAFEGAGISCGSTSIAGAIDRVWARNGRLQVHTIHDIPARSICGSGLLDAIAASLELEFIDETGAIQNIPVLENQLPLTEAVFLTQKDIRAFQLAKAAIAAGIQTLLQEAGVAGQDVKQLYIAGGFGSRLSVTSAVKVGLIPAVLADRATVLGNASLQGALELMLDVQKISVIREFAGKSCHVDLGGNPRFNENYVEQMLFE